MDTEHIIKEIKEKGFYLYHQTLENPKELMEKAHKLCSTKNYKRGGNYKGNFNMEACLRNLVTSPDVEKIFAAFDAPPQEIYITYENDPNHITRNNYLHFDRWRCMKSLVYLEDVYEDSGPFTIVSGSHIKGAELRKKFRNHQDYETIYNRIDLDYPEIEYELLPIVGPAGTTVLFDTDLFHMGGSVKEGFSRTVIRSHWYRDMQWRKS